MEQQHASRLSAVVRQWGLSHPPGWASRGAPDIAKELAGDAQFGDIQLAGWLQSPDGKFLTQLVRASLPFPGDLEVAVMVKAIEIAAQKRTGGQAFLTLAAGLVAVLIIASLFDMSRNTHTNRGRHGAR